MVKNIVFNFTQNCGLDWNSVSTEFPFALDKLIISLKISKKIKGTNLGKVKVTTL